MSWDTIINYCLSGGIPLSVGWWFIRSIMQRLNELEDQTKQIRTEQQIRDMISDKLDPIHDTLYNINENIRKLFELYSRNQ